ncbi:MAG: DUF697 domain-containing protein [Oscillatoriales cyanobacterium]|nr:MAG: DUF697 domain-containing protein [Oscillatoriales cyanobacterium]
MPEQSIVRVSRPVLVGGLGLSAGLALWSGLSQWGSWGSEVGSGDGFGAIGLCALGLGTWLWRRRGTTPVTTLQKPTGDRPGAIAALDRLRVAIDRLQGELDLARTEAPQDEASVVETAQPGATVDTLIEIETTIAHWRREHTRLTAALDRDQLTIALLGLPAVGKSTIIQQLTPAIASSSKTGNAVGINWEEITIRADRRSREVTDDRESPSRVSHSSVTPSDSADLHRALLADCVLYTIAGDLTASERRDLEQLERAGQTTIVVWNKSDLVSSADRDRVLGSIRHQLSDLMAADRILPVAAAPRGTVSPQLAPLLTTIDQTLVQRRSERVWQQIQRASTLAIAGIQLSLDRLRRHRAEPIVRRYQWIAATATVANPIPSLDLLASGSIGTQLLIDLSRIYHRDLSLDRARAGFDAIVEMLLKLGLVELSTQVIAGLLKHNPVTFLAGSAAQGLSAAYLIHVIGTSAIVYFETQDTESFAISDTTRPAQTDRPWDTSRFQAILSQTIAHTQRSAFFQALLERATQYFAGVATASSAVAASPTPSIPPS